MTAPMAEVLCDQRIVSAKKYKLHFRADAQTLPIHSFQRGARQYRVLMRFITSANQLTQLLQPRQSIFVCQRSPAAHFFNIGLRMKVVCLIETPAELVREQLAQCGFSRPGNTENDHDHGALICRWRPIFSTRNATATNKV